MAREEQHPVERLREALRAQVPPPMEVSREGAQYWFDEDSAAYCEITVLSVQVASPFVIVVVDVAGPHLEFVVRAWHRYAPEVWHVDVERSTVTRMLRDGTWEEQGVGGVLTSPVLPGVAVPVQTLFPTSAPR